MSKMSNMNKKSGEMILPLAEYRKLWCTKCICYHREKCPKTEKNLGTQKCDMCNCEFVVDLNEKISEICEKCNIQFKKYTENDADEFKFGTQQCDICECIFVVNLNERISEICASCVESIKNKKKTKMIIVRK